jgi:alpha-1,6-mannosyltransferase
MGADAGGHALRRWVGQAPRVCAELTWRWRACVLAMLVPGATRGFVGSSMIAVGGMTPAFLPPSNPLRHVPVLTALQQWPGRVLGTLVLLVGVALLLDAWLRLRPGLGLRQPPPLWTLALWSTPLLLAAPMFSSDAYSYAAQGWLVRSGDDPYRMTPAGVPDAFADQVDPMWLHTPAPYGPLTLQIQHLVVDLSGGSPYLSAVAMRVPAMLGVALIAVLLPRLASRIGLDPARAAWLGVLNPLVLIHFVAGSHNDALMVGTVVLALWLATHRQTALSVVAVALAAAIKQPAALALPVVAVLSAPQVPARDDPRVPWLRLTLVSLAGALAFALVTVWTGLGWGWVSNLWVPSSVRPVLSPLTAVGALSEFLLKGSGLNNTTAVVVPAVHVLGLVAVLIFVGWLVVKVLPREPVRALSWALLALAVGGPALQTWYLLWGGVLLGATSLSRAGFRWAIWATALLVSYSAVDASFRNGAVAYGATAVAALIWVVTGHDRHGSRHVPEATPAVHDADTATAADQGRSSLPSLPD